MTCNQLQWMHSGENLPPRIADATLSVWPLVLGTQERPMALRPGEKPRIMPLRALITHSQAQLPGTPNHAAPESFSTTSTQQIFDNQLTLCVHLPLLHIDPTL